MRKLTEYELIENVNKECLVRNYEFLGIAGEFNGARTFLSLHCNIHNHTWKTTNYNMFMGKRKTGCIFCARKKAKINVSLTKEQLIENVKKECSRRGNVEFIEIVGELTNNRTKLKLHCNIHNHNWKTTTYVNFMRDVGCPKCANNVRITQTEAERCVNKKCLKLNYKCADFKYINNKKTYLSLTCDKGHKYNTSYNSFISGCKCHICNISKLEYNMKTELNKNHIEFWSQHSFVKLKNGNGKQTLDFFLPYHNIAIECQGKQHFELVEYFGGESEFEKILERDERKYNICKENGIRILYYTNCKPDIIPDVYHDKIFTNISDLLDEINLN